MPKRKRTRGANTSRAAANTANNSRQTRASTRTRGNLSNHSQEQNSAASSQALSQPSNSAAAGACATATSSSADIEFNLPRTTSATSSRASSTQSQMQVPPSSMASTGTGIINTPVMSSGFSAGGVSQGPGSVVSTWSGNPAMATSSLLGNSSWTSQPSDDTDPTSIRGTDPGLQQIRVRTSISHAVPGEMWSHQQ